MQHRWNKMTRGTLAGALCLLLATGVQAGGYVRGRHSREDLARLNAAAGSNRLATGGLYGNREARLRAVSDKVHVHLNTSTESHFSSHLKQRIKDDSAHLQGRLGLDMKGYLHLSDLPEWATGQRVPHIQMNADTKRLTANFLGNLSRGDVGEVPEARELTADEIAGAVGLDNIIVSKTGENEYRFTDALTSDYMIVWGDPHYGNKADRMLGGFTARIQTIVWPSNDPACPTILVLKADGDGPEHGYLIELWIIGKEGWIHMSGLRKGPQLGSRGEGAMFLYKAMLGADVIQIPTRLHFVPGVSEIRDTAGLRPGSQSGSAPPVPVPTRDYDLSRRYESILFARRGSINGIPLPELELQARDRQAQAAAKIPQAVFPGSAELGDGFDKEVRKLAGETASTYTDELEVLALYEGVINKISEIDHDFEDQSALMSPQRHNELAKHRDELLKQAAELESKLKQRESGESNGSASRLREEVEAIVRKLDALKTRGKIRSDLRPRAGGAGRPAPRSRRGLLCANSEANMTFFRPITTLFVSILITVAAVVAAGDAPPATPLDPMARLARLEREQALNGEAVAEVQTIGGILKSMELDVPTLESQGIPGEPLDGERKSTGQFDVVIYPVFAEKLDAVLSLIPGETDYLLVLTWKDTREHRISARLDPNRRSIEGRETTLTGPVRVVLPTRPQVWIDWVDAEAPAATLLVRVFNGYSRYRIEAEPNRPIRGTRAPDYRRGTDRPDGRTTLVGLLNDDLLVIPPGQAPQIGGLDEQNVFLLELFQQWGGNATSTREPWQHHLMEALAEFDSQNARKDDRSPVESLEIRRARLNEQRDLLAEIKAAAEPLAVASMAARAELIRLNHEEFEARLQIRDRVEEEALEASGLYRDLLMEFKLIADPGHDRTAPTPGNPTP